MKAKVIVLFSIFSHVKYNLLDILACEFFFKYNYIIFNKYFPCILLLFI